MSKRDTAQISAVLPVEFIDRLDAYAKAHLMSRADAIRQLLMHSLTAKSRRSTKS